MIPKYMRDLRKKMDERFSEGELKGLAFDLTVDWEHLLGKTKPEKIRSLISHRARRGKLEDLVELLREERPDATWGDPPPKEQQVEDAQATLTDQERDAELQTYLKGIEKYIELNQHNKTSIAMTQALTDKVWSYLDFNRRKMVINLLIKTGIFEKLDHEQRNLAGAKIVGVNLVGANFNASNLQGAIFSSKTRGDILVGDELMEKARIEFQKKSKEKVFLVPSKITTLSQAKFDNANLSNTILRKVNLTAARLNGANLANSSLEGANLVSARLYKANLAGADLTKAKVHVKDLRQAILDTNTIMPDGKYFRGWRK